MRPFSTFVFAFVLISLVCFSSPASATIIFQDDYERVTAGTAVSTVTPLVGDSYAGSAGTVRGTATNPPGVGAGGSSKFVQLSLANGDNLVIKAADKTATAGQVITTELDMYPVTSTDTSTGRVTSFLGSTPNWTTAGFDIGVRGNGSLWKYEGGADWINVAGAGTVHTNQWIHVKVVGDYTLHTFAATVDGYNFSGAFAGSTPASSYGSLYMSAQNNTNRFYDNVVVYTGVIPEPSTLVLLASGLIGLLCYAWRKRR